MEIVIGNHEDATIQYQSPFLEGAVLKIHKTKEQIVLEKNNCLLYVNKQSLLNSAYYIQYGDQFQFYGLQFFFLKDYLFINNLEGKVQIDEQKSHLQPFSFPKELAPINDEIKDEDLYQKEN